MSIPNPIQSKDVVFIQRSKDNSKYGEVHISGTMLIPYIDSDGNINADGAASFYNKFPPSGIIGDPGGSGLVIGSTYEITASWSNNSVSSLSSSWASSSFSATSASWASSSFSATSSSFASRSLVAHSSSFASRSLVAHSSSFASSSLTATSASWASSSTSASYLFGPHTGSTFGTSSWASSSLIATSASWSSSSFETSTVVCNSNVTTSLILYPKNTNNSLFVDYMLNDGVNYRAGKVVLIYTPSTSRVAEICTVDIGNTDGLSIGSDIVVDNIRLFSVNNTASDFDIKFNYSSL